MTGKAENMKHEPTAATLTGIYKLLDMELDDLNAVDIREAERAFCMLCEATDGIRDELRDIFIIMQDVGSVQDGIIPDPEELHGQFTEIYRNAVEIAGKSVRLAAIARMGIIQSETMNPIDRVHEQEDGGHGKTG